MKETPTRSITNRNGTSLIELLVALVICAIVLAGSYHLFISQTRAYGIQDQVIETQQNLRLAMETLLRDLRMAGYDDDGPRSTITISEPIAIPLRDDAITLSYEHYDKTALEYQNHTIAYWREGDPPKLIRQLSINEITVSSEVLIENLKTFRFTYGIDADGDQEMDRWVSAEDVGQNRVMAIHVVLCAAPSVNNPDLRLIAPRTLASAVTLRNLCMGR